jgi:hypothetical protein
MSTAPRHSGRHRWANGLLVAGAVAITACSGASSGASSDGSIATTPVAATTSTPAATSPPAEGPWAPIRRPVAAAGSQTHRGPYRWAYPPLVLIAEAEGEGATYEVFVHFNRHVPPGKLVILLDGQTEPGIRPVVESPTCDEVSIGLGTPLYGPAPPARLLHPRPGQWVRVTLDVGGRRPGRASIRVRIAGNAPDTGSDAPFWRLVSCPTSPHP